MCDGCRMLYYVLLTVMRILLTLKKWAKMMIMREILPVNILSLVQ